MNLTAQQEAAVAATGNVLELVFYGSILLIGWMAWLIVQPFLVEIAWAVVLAICLEPFRQRAVPRLGPTWSALVLTLLVLVIYVLIIPFNFLEPFKNRDVLIVYNVMLFAVMGLLLGATPLRADDLSPKLKSALRTGILAVAVLAGFGTARLRQAGASTAVVLALGGLYLVESAAIPAPLGRSDPVAGLAGPPPTLSALEPVPAVYRAVQELPESAVLLELPYGYPRSARPARRHPSSARPFSGTRRPDPCA